MKRKIITIDADKCNGCGACIDACAEGALQLVGGKAKLVKEQFCDGFGDCLGECPTGALKIEETAAPAYDPAATRQHVVQAGGAQAVHRFEAAAQRHEQPASTRPGPGPHTPHDASGCPGTRMRVPAPEAFAAAVPSAGNGLPPHVQSSELRQWPIQIHLVPPGAPFFKDQELVVMSTCAPLASADVHWRFLRGRAVVVGCPKLDDTSGYAEKLAAILAEPSIPRVLVVRMEVPCCGGLTALVEQAAARSGRSDLAVDEVTVGINGDVLQTEPVVKGGA